MRRKPLPPTDLPRLWRSLAREHPDPLAPLRLEWCLRLRETGNASAAARHSGVSRKCLRLWAGRFAARGVDGLGRRSSAPASRRSWSLPGETRDRIASLKREFPAWGREKLRIVYRRRYGDPPSEWQFQRTIAARGLQWKRPKARRKPGKAGVRPRIQGLEQGALPPFALVHGDSVELRYADGQKRFIFTNLEHASRKGFALAAPTKHARHAARLLGMTKAEHPELIHYHSDNGGDQAGDLDLELPADVIHWVSRPRIPEDNPRLERFHRTLIADCFPSQAGPAPAVAEMQATIDAWLPVYSGVRPHAALGMLTPEEYIEANAPSEGGTHVVI